MKQEKKCQTSICNQSLNAWNIIHTYIRCNVHKYNKSHKLLDLYHTLWTFTWKTSSGSSHEPRRNIYVLTWPFILPWHSPVIVTCWCLKYPHCQNSYKYTTHYSTLNHNIIQQSSYLQDHNCRDYVLNSKV